MPTAPTRKEQLLKVSPDDIEDTYRKGYITAADRNRIVREKAHVTTESLLEEKGYLGAMFAQSVKNVQAGWDNLKEAATRSPKTGLGGAELDVTNELYYIGLAVWGQVQMLTAPLNAIGEVTGQVAENMALKAGASPGLARVINIATDVATGFVPIGTAAKSGAKGIKAIGDARKAKAAAKVAEAQKAAKAGEAEALVNKVLAEGLEADGVRDAAKIIAKPSAVDEEGAKAIKAIEDTIAKEAAPTVQEQFARDMATFRTEMEAATAPQTHEATARMAEKLGLTLDDLKTVSPGQALDEKAMYAYLKALDPQVKTLINLAKTAVSEGTEQSANALAQHASQFFTVAPMFRRAEVTAGRSVEILKETPPMKQITNLLMGWDPDAIAKGDFVGAMQTFAEDIAALADKPDTLKALAVQSQMGWARFKEQWWPMARTAYMNLLLARPLTQVRNFVGNGIATSNAVMERMAGGLFSASDKGVANGEAFYLMKGMAAAMGDGLKAFGEAFKGLTPDEISRFDVMPGRIPGALGRIIQSPGDTMRGMDNFFKTLFRRGSYYAQAMREGSQIGLQGDNLANFISRRVTNPTERMLKEGEEFALSGTFQNELGTLGSKVRDIAQTGPLVLLFPFMKTPINLAKYAWNRTPGLQFASKSLYDDILAGGVRADMAIGRLTMSNLTGMFLFELAKEGVITGSGPVDPGLRRVWLTTNQPYSIKTKEGWIPISNMEPGNTILGMVADYAQVMNQLDDPTAGQAAMALSFSLMHNLADKSYWQTVSDLVDVSSGIARGQDPSRGLRDTFMAPVTAVATGGPVGAGIARAMDPIRRETRTYLDTIMARVPGYSQTLPPARDPYGDPILPPQAVGGPWLGLVSPLTEKPLETDRVKLEGEKLQIKAPAWPWDIGGTTRDDFDIRAPLPEDRVGAELTPQQRDRWQVMYRDMLRSPEFGIEKQLLDNPVYQKQTRAAKREMFMDMLADYRATAREALLVEDTTLGKKIVENDARRLLPLLQEQDRAKAEAQVTETVTLFDRLAPQQRANLLRWGNNENEEAE